MLPRGILLIVGVFACSTAIIMVQASITHPVLLSAQRLIIAAVALSPLLLRDLRRNRGCLSRAHLRRTILPGLMLGLHFVTWIIGGRLTGAANASLIVNMVPIAMPLLLHFMIRERLTPGEWIGTALSMIGLLLLAGGDYHLSAEWFIGDVMCFLSMLLFALYLALARRNRDFGSIWSYLVPLYVVGAAACFVAAVVLAGVWAVPGGRELLEAIGIGKVHPLSVPRPQDWAYALGLGLIPTVIGHSTLNYSMKHFGGQTVSIANLGQFIFAGLLAYVIHSQVPPSLFYLAAVPVVTGAVLALRSTPARSKVPPASKFAPPRSES
jgi:drug/metabolite transporter (DMT)-like permease